MELHGDAAVLEFERIYATPTAGSGADVEGTWVEMVPEGGTSWTAPFDIYGFRLNIDTPGAAYDDFWIDIGISIDGGTTIDEILSDMRFYSGYPTNNYVGEDVFIPLAIPRGASVYTRIKSSDTTAPSLFVGIYPNTKPLTGRIASKYIRSDVSLPADQTGHTTWAEISPSLPFDVRYVIISSSLAGITTIPADGGGWYAFWAGAAGAEVRLAPRAGGFDHPLENLIDRSVPSIIGRAMSIPKGERLSLTHQTASTYGYNYSVYLFA